MIVLGTINSKAPNEIEHDYDHEQEHEWASSTLLDWRADFVAPLRP